MKRTQWKPKGRVGVAVKPKPPLKRTVARRKGQNKGKSKLPKDQVWSLKKADAEFSIYIRNRDKVCARCGTTKNLTNSHFWPRQHKATRFDPKNCIALCWMPCHKYHWEKEKQGAYRDFMLKWLGEEEYALLEKRAGSTHNQREAIIACMALLAAPQSLVN